MSASVVNSTKLAPALNFKQLDSSTSSPLYRKLYPSNSQPRSFILPKAGTLQPLMFTIPSEVVNLGESYLEYDLKIPAQAAGTYIWMYRDTRGEFDGIVYRDTGSQYIVNIATNAHLYQQMTSRLNMSGEHLAENDALHGLAPTNAPLSDVKCVRFDGTTCNQAYREPQQLEMISSAGAASASNVIKRRVYLKDLVPDSYFGLAKNGVMPVETYLEFNFSNGPGRIGFTSTSAVDPTLGPAASFTIDAKTPDYNIANIALNLCYEQNQEIVKGMKDKIATGWTLPFPMVKLQQLTVDGTSTTFAHNIALDAKSHGKKIKRIVYTALKNAGSTNDVYDHQNVSGSQKIKQYRTLLDNKDLQRDVLNTDNYDDYLNNKPLLQGSCYFNQPIYLQNWIHIDSWSYDDKKSEMVGGGAIMTDGLLLDKPMTYTVNVTSCTGALYSNFVAICGIRQLIVSPTSYVVV